MYVQRNIMARSRHHCCPCIVDYTGSCQ